MIAIRKQVDGSLEGKSSQMPLTMSVNVKQSATSDF